MKQLKKKFIGIGFICSVIAIFAFSTPGDRLFDIAKNLDIYASVFKELNKFYVDEINPNTAIKTSIDALLKSFDPYTVFYPEDELEDYLTMTTGKYQGIGIILEEINHKHYIVYVDENSPAAKAKLGIGDQITAVNGIDISEKSDVDHAKLMKGQAGTKLSMMIIKNGKSSPEEIQVIRETVQINNVVYSGMIRPEVGYILLEDFNSSAAKELKNALQNLKKDGMKKLILDLRENPGGLLTQAVDICNLFLKKETKIVETRGKVEEWNKSYLALNPSLEPDLPLIILINNHSASAAEIVAGVMQDYDRAVLIGQKSYGKGLVQVTRDLPYRTKMKITTAKYYIPSGRCIQAIDYQNKNADGSGRSIKDSNQKVFYTQNNRKVIDGGGIQPDINIKKNSGTAFIQTIREDNWAFLYACHYQNLHSTIAPAKVFNFNDAEFDTFSKWLKSQKFTYVSQIEKQMKNLLENSKKDPSYAGLENNLNAIKAEWTSSIDKELKANKKELSELLEAQIILHYYYQKGVKEWSFTKDEAILESIRLFDQPEKFQSILAEKK
ncbi:S41 family peptidase [Aquirufa sp. ROCK-SH2]